MLKRKIAIGLSASRASARREMPTKNRQPLKGSALTVALVVVWLVVKSATVTVAASAAGSDAAAASFAEHCAICHAPNGSGDTVVGKSVKIPDLRSAEVQSQSDAQLAEIIANGKGAMPPFTSLSKDEIDALVKHIHELAKEK
jgi:mono/diheme cytochrome c family protein